MQARVSLERRAAVPAGHVEHDLEGHRVRVPEIDHWRIAYEILKQPARFVGQDKLLRVGISSIGAYYDTETGEVCAVAPVEAICSDPAWLHEAAFIARFGRFPV